MKKIKALCSIAMLALVILGLTACGKAQRELAAITITADKYEAEINEAITLTIDAKDQFGDAIPVDESEYIITIAENEENSTINNLTVSFSEAGSFSINVSVRNTEISNSLDVEIYENSIKSVVDRKAVGETISTKIYFQLAHDFAFSDYNFVADKETDPVAWANEYSETYNNFYNGNEVEKAEAINKLGNDILVRFISIDPTENATVLSAKNKSWSGYLNYCPELYPSETPKLEGENFERILDANTTDYYSTAINLAAANYSGHTIRVELYIIEDGRVFASTYSFIIE